MAQPLAHLTERRRQRQPAVKAAGLAVRGDHEGAVRLARERIERRSSDAGAHLVLACVALERAESAAFDSHVSALEAQGLAEAAVLRDLWRRRQNGTRSWSRDFAEAWNACARPDFSQHPVLKDAPEPVQPIDEVELRRRAPSAEVLLARFAQSPDAPELARMAVDLIGEDAPLALKLVGLLTLSRPSLRGGLDSRAQRVAAEWKRQLVDAMPDNMHVALLALVHGTNGREPFTKVEVEALDAAVQGGTYDFLIGEVYALAKDTFVRAGFEQPVERAFNVAMVAMEIPTMLLGARARITFKRKALRETHTLLQGVLDRVSASLATGKTLFGRLMGISLDERAAPQSGDVSDPAEREALRAELWAMYRANAARGRWPIHALWTELYDRIATNEMEWLEQLGVPAVAPAMVDPPQPTGATA